jgi:hypothetical protein
MVSGMAARGFVAGRHGWGLQRDQVRALYLAEAIASSLMQAGAGLASLNDARPG